MQTQKLKYRDGFEGESAPRPRFSSSPLRDPLVSAIGNSLLKSESAIRKRENDQKPRILLFVPPYTRLIEPAPADSPLHQIGITDEEVMKRAGTPIGLVRIATQLEKAGYEVKLMDAAMEGWDNEKVLMGMPNGGRLIRYGLNDARIREIIQEFGPDIVGVQCNYTVQWGNARALADLVKTVDKTIVVLGGGSHFSGDWKNALVDSPVDFICVNEADASAVKLVDTLTSRDGRPDVVGGVAYRQNGQIIRNDRPCGESDYQSNYVSIRPAKQTLRERLERFPLPDFKFVNMCLFDTPFNSAGARIVPYGTYAQTFATIGCNVRCEFCYIWKGAGPWRALGLDWFDAHLSDLKKQGVTQILLEDDHILHDPLYALGVFKLLKRHDMAWVEEGGLSLFNLILLLKGKEILTNEEGEDPKYEHVLKAIKAGINAESLIKAMAECGCKGAYLAVESANVESLGNSNKPKLNADQEATMEIIRLFSKHGISVTGGFMLGFVNLPRESGGVPYIETKEQIEGTIRYAKLLMDEGMAYANPFIVTPLPGTPMGEYQQQFVVRDYDTGWSHERATMATSQWTADELETFRWRLMIEANGVEKVREMLKRGTWPV